MNCNTCRYELSQCLDGRLPSGRRTVVMQHADECAECGTFWAELQAAQRLTLQLPRTRVSADFRDSLWERIKAGEGTPAAVFREPVALVTKVRYALTGAAAAAVVLWGAMWLRADGAPSRDELAHVDRTSLDRANLDRPGITVRQPAVIAGEEPSATELFGESSLTSATRPLTFDLVAVETAKQLEQRHATTMLALRNLRSGDTDKGAAIDRVFESADELNAFAEVLLDMRDRGRLWFTDHDVEPALRYTVSLLGKSRRLERSVDTVRNMVAPALDSSPRLGSISRRIMTVPTVDPSEEMEVLANMNRHRPDIFPKLFVIIGSADAAMRFGAPRPFGTFRMTDECGTFLVAPLSELEARDLRRRIEVQIARPARTK